MYRTLNTYAVHARFNACSPSARIVTAFVWVSCVALLPIHLWIWQLPSAVVLALATRGLGISLGLLLRRTRLLWPFLGLTAAGLLGQPEWPLRMGNLVLKSFLSVWILFLLTQTTSMIELTRGLRRLHFPAIWVEVFAFLVRYASVLSLEWRKMHLAREARTFRLGRRARFKLLAQSLGCLFIRAYERAERIHHAMLARGYRAT
ncbi:MAG: hypothetical protein FJ398_14420 [Verrucomicrobia bacterium]|nr:hypothetical protein [Verrucomicrobiota bacterium]